MNGIHVAVFGGLTLLMGFLLGLEMGQESIAEKQCGEDYRIEDSVITCMEATTQGNPNE